MRHLVDPGFRRPIPDPVQGIQVPGIGVLGQDHLDMAPLIESHGKDTPIGREDLPTSFGDATLVALVTAPIVEEGLGKKFSSLIASCSSTIPLVVDGEKRVGATGGTSAIHRDGAAIVRFSGVEFREGDMSVFLVPEGDSFPGAGSEPRTVCCLVRSVLVFCTHAILGEDLGAAFPAIGWNEMCHPVAETRFRAENCDYS